MFHMHSHEEIVMYKRAEIATMVGLVGADVTITSAREPCLTPLTCMCD